MTVPSLLRVLRDRWILVVAAVLAGLVLAAVTTAFMPRTYGSSTSLYVAGADTANATSAYQGGLLSQQRIKSYTELMVSDRVLAPVVDKLGLGETSTELADDVAVSSTANSTIITVTVTDSDPQRAAAIAGAIGDSFSTVVAQIERPRGGPNATPAVTASVVDPATVDTDPVSPRVLANLVIGFVVGLVVGLGAALLRGALDTTVRSTAELTESTGATSFGSLPLVPGLADGAPLLEGRYGEAVRRVRTNLLFADVDDPPRVLAVTSSMPAEGKTTLSCALAAAFAQNARVVVVEADLRRPTVAARLGLVDGVGLTDVLTRRTNLEAAVQRSSRGVDVLVCGTLPPNPSELLSSRQMRDLVERLRSDYDVVILDGPPLAPVADGAVLASLADGALLLCRYGRTVRAHLDQAHEALAAVGARVLGVVLTMAPESSRGQDYDAYESGPAAAARPRPAAPPPAPSRSAPVASAAGRTGQAPVRPASSGPAPRPAPADPAPTRSTQGPASPAASPVPRLGPLPPGWTVNRRPDAASEPRTNGHTNGHAGPASSPTAVVTEEPAAEEVTEVRPDGSASPRPLPGPPSDTPADPGTGGWFGETAGSGDGEETS
jgi:tyrosine-protein kinase